MSIKNCPKCGSSRTKKNGTFRGTQRYRCRSCGVQFVHDTSVSAETLWREFADEHARVSVLARRHHISKSTVHRRLDDCTLPEILPTP
ncbi:IS1/IS1595 family N-terminal zinc-binding domain-containing protein [Bradyrhizobium sp. 6(2017)]|uniref:IS1/IS1595 family N-terminal zinc-binding domain-containing protein n=1 Tax=Bradyrhizobium sp. 6(2017) TaxID=1197460 RepID=UPI003BB922AF